MRMTLLTNVPAPYRTPLYSLVNERLRDRGGRLTVVYGARREPRNQWLGDDRQPAGVSTVFLSDEPLVIRGHATYASPNVIRALARTRPEVVVMGGYAPWLYLAAAWCRARRVPFLIWSAETLDSIKVKPRPRTARVPLWAAAAGFLAYGPAARDYLVQVGRVDPDRVTVLGNGIDFGAFAARADALRPERRRLRADRGFDTPILLSVGGKNAALVVEAAGRLHPPATVVVVGRELEIASEHPVVRCLGRVPPDEMCGLYIASDCLVHVAIDLWPHAINEALAAGLPVVASRTTGAPMELFTGPGCATVESDPDAVAAAVAEAVHVDAPDDPGLSTEIRAPLAPWGVESMASRLLGAAEACVARARS